MNRVEFDYRKKPEKLFAVEIKNMSGMVMYRYYGTRAGAKKFIDQYHFASGCTLSVLETDLSWHAAP